MVIDAHQHFWNYDPIRHSWISDEMSVLKRDFLPHDLKEQLEHNHVDGCVSVQAEQSVAETDFLIELAKDSPMVKGVVGWVDLQSETVAHDLERYSEVSTVVGFRHVVHDEPDREFMLRPGFLRGIGQLASYDFTYDLLIFPIHLDVSLQVVRQFPELKFVIDHLAKPYIKTGEIDSWKRGMMELSRCDNVWCKVSGMVTEADWNDTSYDQFVPYLEVALELFGSERLIYGSDWPVCQLAASYQTVKSIPDQYFSSLSKDEKKHVMGENAVNFYNLNL